MEKQRALISVSDKEGIVDFAKELSENNFEIISTGGTYKTLKESGIKVIGIEEITRFPECLDGRVKTLHPNVHAGILAKRDDSMHMDKLKELDIQTIDLILINLYPFKETVKKGLPLDECVENIDIGGPTMLRAAAKNYKDVLVVTDKDDYKNVLDLIKKNKAVKNIPAEVKYEYALKVFELTASYDALISKYLREKIAKELPDNPTFTFEKISGLRYGENPHQNASYYKDPFSNESQLVNAKQLNGKELSFNNINDTSAAITCLREFNLSGDKDLNKAACVAVKHANPCGVGIADKILDAYEKAYKGDKTSIFGGIVAFNKEVTKELALKLNEIFLEVIVAPSFSEDALKTLKEKANVRLLVLENLDRKIDNLNNFDLKKMEGGILIQDEDNIVLDENDLKVVTKKEPPKECFEDLKIAMSVVKNVKSNAIVLVKDKGTIGIGPGQTNRIGALEIALNVAKNNGNDVNGAVLASDAFFPFADCVTLAGKAGITCIIQPGGSIKDEESIKKCDELGIAMIFSKIRHFKH